MSENIPESIPTSADPRSKRPTKKRALTPVSQQASQVDALFAKPDRDIKIPTGPVEKKLAPPPEIVNNVQGSSAGAGSGEFHVYKASRRREYERLRAMDEQVKKEEEDEEFARKREEARKADEERTNKAREKRQRRNKKQKGNGKKGAKEGADGESDVKKMKPNPASAHSHKDGEKDGEERANGDTNADEEVGIVIQDAD